MYPSAPYEFSSQCYSLHHNKENPFFVAIADRKALASPSCSWSRFWLQDRLRRLAFTTLFPIYVVSSLAAQPTKHTVLLSSSFGHLQFPTRTPGLRAIDMAVPKVSDLFKSRIGQVKSNGIFGSHPRPLSLFSCPVFVCVSWGTTPTNVLPFGLTNRTSSGHLVISDFSNLCQTLIRGELSRQEIPNVSVVLRY